MVVIRVFPSHILLIACIFAHCSSSSKVPARYANVKGETCPYIMKDSVPSLALRSDKIIMMHSMGSCSRESDQKVTLDIYANICDTSRHGDVIITFESYDCCRQVTTLNTYLLFFKDIENVDGLTYELFGFMKTDASQKEVEMDVAPFFKDCYEVNITVSGYALSFQNGSFEVLPNSSFTVTCNTPNIEASSPYQFAVGFPDGSQTPKTWSKEFHLSPAEHGGQYSCHVYSNQKDLANASVEISIINTTKPYIDIQLLNRFGTKNNDGNWIWHFKVHAWPWPSFTVYQKGNVKAEHMSITENKGFGELEVHIYKARTSDVANYTLKARIHENFSPGIQHSIRKDVKFTLKFNVAPEETSISLPPNEVITSRSLERAVAIRSSQVLSITCKSRAEPQPDILLFVATCPNFDLCDSSKQLNLEPEMEREEYLQTKATWKITLNHTSKVFCQSSNNISENPVKSDEWTVLVSDYETSQPTTEESKDVYEGETLILKCWSFKYITKTISWFKESERLENHITHDTMSNHVISGVTISETSMNSSGIYTCRDSSTHEAIQKMNITVIRPVIPKILGNKNRKISRRKGSDVPFNCSATGKPNPTYKWMKDGLEMPSDMSMDGTMILQNVAQGAKYECFASNIAGNDSAMFELSVSAGREKTGVLNHILLALSAFIATAILISIASKKMKQRKQRYTNQMLWEKGNIDRLSDDIFLHSQTDLLPYNPKWEVKRADIHLGKLLGQGAFGSVYKAEAKNVIIGEETSTVAVKTTRNQLDKAQFKALQSELKILLHIGRHPNIVNLVGACARRSYIDGELLMIVEYCKHGSLLEYLLTVRKVNSHNLIDFEDGINISNDFSQQREYSNVVSPTNTLPNSGHSEAEGYLPMSSEAGSSKSFSVKDSRPVFHSEREIYSTTFDNTAMTDVTFYVSSSNEDQIPLNEAKDIKPLLLRNLLDWSYQIASGMEYLNAKKVLHGDLAARNVLLTENLTAKISDFGFSKDVYKKDIYRMTKEADLPIKWLSIEVIEEKIFSCASDVWAYGVTLWEIYTLGRTPYAGIRMDEHFLERLKTGFRLFCPKYASNDVYNIMLKCWEAKPEDRITFPNVKKDLESLFGVKAIEKSPDFTSADSAISDPPYSTVLISSPKSCLSSNSEEG